MPRVYDFVRSIVDNPVDPVTTLDTGRYGLGELTDDDIVREDTIPGISFGCGIGRKAQFTAGMSLRIPSNYPRDEANQKAGQFQAEMDQVFEWLGQNTTGSWYWHESCMGNNGNHLDIYIHMERQSDQKIFAATWGHLFEYKPDTAADLEFLAVIKGVLPAQEGIASWLSRHGGYTADLGQDDRILKFEIPEMEAAFQRDWVENGPFTHDPSSGSYKGRVTDFLKLYNWLEAHNAFAMDLNRRVEGAKKMPVFVIPRYEIAAQKFREVWGREFREVMIGDTGAMVPTGATGLGIEFSGEFNSTPPRPVPQDFLDYLKGECDFSVVRAPYNNLQTGPAFVIDRTSLESENPNETDYVP